MRAPVRKSILLGAAIVLLGGVAMSQDTEDRDARRERALKLRSLLNEGLGHFQAGSYDSARGAFEAVLETDPRHADGHFHLARTQLAQADTAAALTTLEAGTQAAPLSTRMKLLLARLRIRQGELEAADFLLDGILVVRPRDGETLYLRGLVQLARADSAAALETWGLALEGAEKGTAR